LLKDVAAEVMLNCIDFLQMAMGSADELQYHLLLSRDLGYLKSEIHERVEPQVQEVKRMFAALVRKVDSERS